MKTILVTGGSGFIGSHTCISLIENGYSLIVVDSNINSSEISLERVKHICKKKLLVPSISFQKGDIRNKEFLIKIFSESTKANKSIDGVIHFAGLKSVEESVLNPLKYWDNNVLGSMCLFQVMNEFNCRTIVFSSSATIYGGNSLLPFEESSPIKPLNPYGHTKASIECLLKDLYGSAKDSWRVANLRYFNPVGAHPSGLIGENPLNIPNNLFPYICKVALGIYKELKIFGNNWPTKDGTCIRDYIHVMDLADAHVSALNYLSRSKAQLIEFNIGTGLGTSVLEIVEKFMMINNCKIPYVFCERRLGDVPEIIANNKKAISLLKWKPKRDLEDMCKDGWKWQKNNPNGF